MSYPHIRNQEEGEKKMIGIIKTLIICLTVIIVVEIGEKNHND